MKKKIQQIFPQESFFLLIFLTEKMNNDNILKYFLKFII